MTIVITISSSTGSARIEGDDDRSSLG